MGYDWGRDHGWTLGPVVRARSRDKVYGGFSAVASAIALLNSTQKHSP
jgi:hypothetical protein